MDMLAHGLWTAAAAITANRSAGTNIKVGWAVWWGVFPDVLAFGPLVAVSLWLWLASDANSSSTGGHLLPHVHVGLPLYQLGHSLVVFLLVFGVVTILARRIVFAMLGWLLHILIDIPTHRLRYYATRFLWPISDYRVDGVAWWTPWFWAATYGALGVVYFVLWKRGLIPPSGPSQKATSRRRESEPSEFGR